MDSPVKTLVCGEQPFARMHDGETEGRAAHVITLECQCNLDVPLHTTKHLTLNTDLGWEMKTAIERF